MVARKILYAPIDTAASGDTVLVGGVAGSLVKVLGYVLVADGAVAVRWRTSAAISGVAVNLSGAMSLAANGGVSAWGTRDCPVLEAPLGADLLLNLSGAVGVRGHFAYFTASW